ncbi:MAG: signal peptide peptidase SppA [Alphaproteobacteria bacterium]|nr:signal peptide peptidase SppA [Alphaproteobacteria bacterium]MBU1512758.1 signal peptide peptidase SppA [Alphaproteobacteria bacterium]MBU2096137.1 signal peptide peptidase SppA [Alphaproteobacteria bacterium]MBU2152831.1 signal peptide peptidase SppA [Alphaproteobacteria bacterium]MBU2307973.1 signal peptide peptidase SppA [Alphaproteobacteria bacterium]
MKQFLITAAGVFAGLIIFLVGVPIVLIGMAMSATAPAPTPGKAILELDLRAPLTDQAPHNPLWGIGRNSTSVMSIIETLRRAEKDDKIKGMLVRLPEGGIEPGMADEIRLAFNHFRAAGKPIYTHSQGLYPSGMVTTTYMLGRASDQFWMQPGASLQVTGVATEDLFFKRFFDKYGVVPQYEQRYEYKNAVNGYLYSDYTAAHKESTLSWMGSVYTSNLGFAAADRKADPAVLRTALEAGPYLAEDALTLRLIDHLGQVREAQQALLDKAGDGARPMDFDDYADNRSARDAAKPGDAIAVIEAEGAILTGKDQGSNPFTGGGSSIYSDDLADAILRAAKANSIKAIVLRVNSPGGSDTASEQILDAIRVAKSKGKPVVISMGTYAASGGYWISSEASAIVAQPTTLTGSIGVFGGKFAIGPALARFGVDVRETGVGGPYAGAFGMGQPFTPAQRAAFAGWMDRIYGNFITRVATGRNLPPERVREIAKGRVWTGAQAESLGLVDEIGGFYQAVDKAKQLAKLEGDVPLRRMSPQEGAFKALQNALGVSATSARSLAAAAWVFGDPRAQSIIDQVAEAKLRGEGGGTVLAPMPLH